MMASLLRPMIRSYFVHQTLRPGLTTANPSILASPFRQSRGSSFSSWSRNTHSHKIPSLTQGIIGTFTLTILSGVTYLHQYLEGFEGLSRSLQFFTVAMPSYLEYKMYMRNNYSNETWDALHRRTSQKSLQLIRKMKGFYIKGGQICAANIGNAFPKIWQETMTVLQDQCPGKDMATVRQIIEEEYGKHLEEVFSSFEETPLGRASIGQVHRATVRDDGREVVVKVMYPGVENLFRGDVRTLKMFCRVAMPEHVPPLEEIERQFMTEFDYVREAQQLQIVYDNLQKVGLVGDKMSPCVVPQPRMDLCTKRVLVMDELKGEKLADGLQKDMERHARRRGLSVETLRQMSHDDSHNSPKRRTSQEYKKYIRLLNVRRKMWNLGTGMYNYTLGWLPGFPWKEYVHRDELPLNHAQLIYDLMYVHGHEVLVDGFFNGDPHPGNILLVGMDTPNPQLGLIDYGQVKRLTKEERVHLCKIIIALANENKPEVISLMKNAGYKSKYMVGDNIYAITKIAYDEDNKELTKGKHIQVFMDELQARDPIIHIPEQYIMVGRTSLILRGLAHALQQSQSVAKAWKPIAESILQEEDGNV